MDRQSGIWWKTLQKITRIGFFNFEPQQGLTLCILVDFPIQIDKYGIAYF